MRTRSFSEPTVRNFLRKPLILGVPGTALIVLSSGVLVLFIGLGNSAKGDLVAASLGLGGYAVLRLSHRFAKNGWEESLLWFIEKRLSRLKKSKHSAPSRSVLKIIPSSLQIEAPDTFDERCMIAAKLKMVERLCDLRPSQRVTLLCEVTDRGAELQEVSEVLSAQLGRAPDYWTVTNGLLDAGDFVYSMHQLPVSTDPLTLFAMLRKIQGAVTVICTFVGRDQLELKSRIAKSRRGNSPISGRSSDVDADITFEESSSVLRGVSRGDEVIVETSLVVISREALTLDPSLFCLEKDGALAVLSALGIRKRLHRSHLVRAVTAVDLIPNLLDPLEKGPSILTTPRGKPLYFSPSDPRLEALHWVVVGASGSGKSFFTGLVLKRMIDGREPLSVIFIDHNRSFRRLVRAFGQAYFEPNNLDETRDSLTRLLRSVNEPFQMVGIELSDLDQSDKKAAIRTLLRSIEEFLRARNTIHPVYLVLDECWNFMRDEPVLVQRAFREFRKLNGAAIAVTQSLSDFLTDESGQSIFQNAPIRILLRQGEDPQQYQGILGLNSVELELVRSLRQEKGRFSECLIKTPFLSRIGRLFPTPEEYELLRTDNLREEWIADELKRRRLACAAAF